MSATATPAKRAAAKKTAPRPRKTVPAAPDSDVEAPGDELGEEESEAPLVSFDDDDFAASEQVLIFELDGTKYYAPKRPSTGVALGYLSYLRKNREDLAYAWLIEQMCGPEAYEALCAHPKMRETGFAKVVGACQRLLKEGAGPKVSPTSRRSSTRKRRG